MMRHYPIEEWQLFVQGNLSDSQLILMEDHLAGCDCCREVFLSLIDEAAVGQAEKTLSPNFSTQVMQAAGVETVGQKAAPAASRKKKISAARKKNFFDFAMAAAVTLLFVGSGYFQLVIDRVPEVAAYSSEQKMAVDLDWPGKMAGQAVNWLNQWETKETGGQDVE